MMGHCCCPGRWCRACRRMAVRRAWQSGRASTARRAGAAGSPAAAPAPGWLASPRTPPACMHSNQCTPAPREFLNASVHEQVICSCKHCLCCAVSPTKPLAKGIPIAATFSACRNYAGHRQTDRTGIFRADRQYRREPLFSF